MTKFSYLQEPVPIKCIVSVSGGFTSTALLPIVAAQKYGYKNIDLVMCVLPNEHPSTWEFCDAVERVYQKKITYIAYCKDNGYKLVDKQDRADTQKLFTPFDIFFDVKFLGNSRVDPCSRLLKRETIRKYIVDTYNPLYTHIAIGIAEHEMDRAVPIRENWQNNTEFKPVFPLLGVSDLSRNEQMWVMEKFFGVVPDLYRNNFEHNNCGGACVKAGQRQWAQLFYYYPDVYKEWEELEQRFVREVGEYTILRKVIDGEKVFLSLKDFREQYIEPAICGSGKQTFLSKFLHSLPGNPGCAYCSAM